MKVNVSREDWVIKKTCIALYLSQVQGYEIHAQNVIFHMDSNLPDFLLFIAVYWK